MNRSDITDTLIHFVSAESNALALETLWCIIYERRLLGTDRMIKGSYRCVCFTEAPPEHVSEILLHAEATGHRYKPFGVVFTKAHLFQHGGRPVIYQPAEEYGLLPEALQWRHVRYEPNATPPIDFTWEREWRLRTDEFQLSSRDCVLIVPNATADAELRTRHDAEEYSKSELRAETELIGTVPATGWRPSRG